MKENGRFLTFKEFLSKYHLRTNFLQFYQILSAIPRHLKEKAQTTNQDQIPNQRVSGPFSLNSNTQIDLEKCKTRDYYRLLLAQKHQLPHTGPERWSKDLSMNKESWNEIFKANTLVCKDTKLREFQYKLIHRIVVTKRELFRYGISTDDVCINCGEPDSINHTFISCTTTAAFTDQVINWFNNCNGTSFKPNIKEILFATFNYSIDQNLARKLNYTLLFLKYYVYSNR